MKGLRGLGSNKWLLGPGYKISHVGHVSLLDPWTSSGIPTAQRYHHREQPGLTGEAP